MLQAGPAVIGVVRDRSVAQYRLTGYSAAEIIPVGAPATTITEATVAQGADGVTLLSFTRPLAAGAPAHASERSIDPAGDTGFIYAWGFGGISDHGANRGFVTLQLAPAVCNSTTTCRGRGVCRPGALANAASPCACTIGHTGATCQSCAAGFELSAPTQRCMPAADTTVRRTVTASTSLRLSLDFATTAGTEGSATRSTFKSNFAADLARTLRIPASRINVTSVAAGSIVVGFTVLPPNVSDSTAPSAPEVVVALSEAISNTTSLLYVGSSVTHAVNGSAPLEASFASQSVTYTFTAALTPQLTLSWALTNGGSTLAARAVWTGATNAWWAVGINSGGLSMGGSDVVAYEPGNSGDGTGAASLSQYTVGSRESSSIVRVGAGASQLADVTIVKPLTGGVVVTWTRPVAAGSYSGAIAIPTTATTTLVYAFGGAGATVIARHAPTDAGGGTVNFASGSYTALDRVTSPIIIAHAVFMSLSWLLLLPLGVFLARYCKHRPPLSGPNAWWFRAHRITQVVGTVVNILAFILAVASVPAGSHGTQTHHILGFIVFGLGMLQPINAAVRPAKTDATTGQRTCVRAAWEVVHKGSGYAALVLAVVAVFLGIALRGSPTAGVGVVAAWVAVVVVAFTIAELRLRCVSASPSSASSTGKPIGDRRRGSNGSGHVKVLSPDPPDPAPYSPQPSPAVVVSGSVVGVSGSGVAVGVGTMGVEAYMTNAMRSGGGSGGGGGGRPGSARNQWGPAATSTAPPAGGGGGAARVVVVPGGRM